MKVKVVIEGLGNMEVELLRFRAPGVVSAILSKMPIEGRLAVFGHQVYFVVGLKRAGDKLTNYVEKGAVAYWPSGDAICFFLREGRPYGSVCVIGKITKGAELLEKVRMGMKVRMELASR